MRHALGRIGSEAVEPDMTTADLSQLVGDDARKTRFCDVLTAIVRETKRAPIFVLDKDGTLTQPRQPLALEMAASVAALLDTGATLAVMSGAEAYRLQDEVLAPLAERIGEGALSAFYLIAENGAQTYRAEPGGLAPVDRLDLREALGAERFAQVLAIVEEARIKFGIGDDPARRHVVSDGSQIKLSALGNVVDEALRQRFDPLGAKRAEWVTFIRGRLVEQGLSDDLGPLVDVIVSGTSSINLLPRGVNKGHALKRFAARHGLGDQSVIYFGDRFADGGNDVYALAHARLAINVGDDIARDDVIDAAEKGPDGARRYLELARRVLASIPAS